MSHSSNKHPDDEEKWDASGPARSKRSKKKDSKLINEAYKRVEPSEPMVFSPSVMHTPYENLSYGSRRKVLIQDIVDKFNLEQWDAVETECTTLIDSINNFDKHNHEKLLAQNIDPKGRTVVCVQEVQAYYYRAYARRQLEMEVDAIDDLTKALTVIDTYCQVLGESFKNHGMSVANTLQSRAGCLHDLYHKTHDISHLDGAICDMRACCAAVRGTDERQLDTNVNEPAKHVRFLLELMMLQKLASGANRPHFSPKEREEIEKELGLGRHSKDNYHCRHCGKDESIEGVPLQLCGKCQQVWYCSKACQAKDWKCGHKNVCEPPVEVHAAPDGTKAGMDDEYTRKHCCNGVYNDKPAMFLRDPSTGRYFESLSDADVFFLPSETVQFEEFKAKKMLEAKEAMQQARKQRKQQSKKKTETPFEDLVFGTDI